VDNQRKDPLVGDLVSLHSPEGDDAVADMGIVVAVYTKFYGETKSRYSTYTVLGKNGDAREYDEPFWEARILNGA